MRKINLLLAALVVSMAAYSQDGSDRRGTRGALEVKKSVFFADGSLDEYTLSEWNSAFTRVDNHVRYSASGAMLEQVEFIYNDDKGYVITKINRDSEYRQKNYIGYQYNSQGYIVREILIDNSVKRLSTCEYSYDNNGNRTSRIIRNRTEDKLAETVYTFDNQGRMTSSQTTDGKGSAINSTQYTYDDQGNLIKQVVLNNEGKPGWIINAVWRGGREVKNELVSADGSIQIRVTNEYGRDVELIKKTVENFQGDSKQLMQYEYVFRRDRPGTVALGFAAQEDVDIYAYLYNAATTNTSQLDILQFMSEARLSGAGGFYAKALQKLLAEYKNISNGAQRIAADEQAILLSAMLGAEKYTQAAADLWLVVDGFSSPLVKAEALMALGKIRATAYLPRIIRVLENLNASTPADRLNGERIAFGAIIALEKFQDPSGYLPVFAASTGWYSQRIRNQATKSLALIAKNPTPYLLQVVKGAGYDSPTKFAALKTIEAANVDYKDKVNVAVAALTEGHRLVTNDVKIKETLAEMRKLALSMINRYKTDDVSVYLLLERSYSNGYDMQEKVEAVRTLASLKTDESARLLSKFLMDLNNKSLNGIISREDEQIVRIIIPSLGQTGRALGRESLSQVGTSDWSASIKTLAVDALRNLPN